MKLVISGIVVLALAGCQSPSAPSSANSSAPSEPSALDTQPFASESGTGSNPSTSELINPMPDASSIPEKPVIPEAKPVQKPGQNGWSQSKLTMADVGKRIGRSLTSLTATECRAVVLIKTPTGMGTIYLSYLIDSPNLYRMEYLEPDSEPRRVVILSEGKSKRELTAKKLSSPVALVTPMTSPAILSDPNRFAREFSRSLVAGVVDRTNAWGQLVANLSKSNSGFTASIEERHPIVEGKQTVNYRIWAKRAPGAVKKLGAAEFEIVLDPKRWLPVTIRTESVDLKGKKWSYDWTAGWRFNQKIDKKYFDFKTPPMLDDK